MYHWKVELLELTRVSLEEGHPGLSSFPDLSSGLNYIDSPDSISWASQDPKFPWEAEAPHPGLSPSSGAIGTILVPGIKP